MDSLLLGYNLTAGIVAAAAFVAAVLVGLLATRLHRRGFLEAQAGLSVLHSLKWGELAHCMVDAFCTRGYDCDDTERKPGDGGFDLLLRKGGERWLLQCKHGGAYNVGEELVRELAELMREQGATGGILATTGRFDARAHRETRGRSIELLQGEALWRLLKPHLPAALVEQARDLTGSVRRRKAAAVFATAALAAVVAYAGAWHALLPEPAAQIAAVEPRPQAAPAPPPQLARSAPPPLSAEEQSARRLDAIEEIAAIAGVVSVDWASKSTLAVALRAGPILAGVCAVLARFDELRYSRIQVRPFEYGRANETRVRWHQCR
jgi:hypothetical protein